MKKTWRRKWFLPACIFIMGLVGWMIDINLSRSAHGTLQESFSITDEPLDPIILSNRSVVATSQEHPSDYALVIKEIEFKQRHSDHSPYGQVKTLMAYPSNQRVSSKATTNGDTKKKQPSHLSELQRSKMCVAENSDAWLQGPRLSNMEALNATIVRTSMMPFLLPNMDSLLEQTICHKKGRFRTTAAAAAAATADVDLDDLEMKLLYLAIHWYHHRPSFQEHQLRSACNATLLYETFGLGPLDYECPNSKFLVTTFSPNGFGANVRLGMVAHILLAMLVDRIPIFIKDTPIGPKVFQRPWFLASCRRPRRREWQCMFLPTTPCVLTHQDLVEAPILTEPHAGRLRSHGMFPTEFQETRVVILLPKLAGTNIELLQKGPLQTLHQLAVELIEGWKNHAITNATTATTAAATTGNRSNMTPIISWDRWEAAAERILHETDRPRATRQEGTKRYLYPYRDMKLAHAIVLYLLRPNPTAQLAIQSRLTDLIPPKFQSHDALGMAIRGSDKCLVESTCLPFSAYMDLARQTRSNGTLILTTEDKAIFQHHVPYNRNFNESSTFPLGFVVNDQDVFQGTGWGPSFGRLADDVMKNSLISLQLQLHANHIIGNCCSNFYQLLIDLMDVGCGLDWNPTVTCLQETTDYQVCCVWDPSNSCTPSAQWNHTK